MSILVQQPQSCLAQSQAPTSSNLVMLNKCVLIVFGLLCVLEAFGSIHQSVNSPNKLSKIEDPGACACTAGDCGCCAGIRIPNILNEEGCLNITYVSVSRTLSLIFSLNDKVVYKGSVSVFDPDVCFDIGIADLDVCLDWYNMQISGAKVSGCVRVDFYIVINVGSFELGCFSFDV